MADRFPDPPAFLRQGGASTVLWLQKVVSDLIIAGQAATTTTIGNVLKAASVSDASASSVSVDSSDATNLATVITLANENKEDTNQLVTDLNVLKDKLNELLASERAAGQLDT